MFFTLKVIMVFEAAMSGKKNISKAILELLANKPYERTIAQIAKGLELSTTEVHFKVRTLVEIRQIVPTRKSGNAQMYCKKELKAEVV